MTRLPDFDQLVGDDLTLDERERLRHVHELLISAGPPPELPPSLERGPTLAMTLGRTKRQIQRRVALLAAAVVVLAIAFLGGYIAANRGGGVATGRVLQLHGTAAAPSALASLRILPKDDAGNWPMELGATGLPKLPVRSYYEVYLVRDGKIFAPCGTFVSSGKGSVSVRLNAPYRLRPGDSWVVTKQSPAQEPGPVVLRPSSSSA